MKNKLVILMLALLCVACVGKNAKKEEAKADEPKVTTIVLGVQVGDVIKSLAVDKSDENLIAAIQAADEWAERYDGGACRLSAYLKAFVKEYRKLSGGKSIANLFVSVDSEIKSYMSNDVVVEILRTAMQNAVESVAVVANNRVSTLCGVSVRVLSMPLLSRVRIELPIDADVERAKKVLLTTASLEFWPTYSAQGANARNNANVVLNKMQAADKAVQKYLENDPTKKTNPSLLQVLNVFNIGGGIIGGVETEAEQNVVSEYLALPEVNKIFGDNVLFMWSANNKSFNNMYMLYAIYDEDADGNAPLDGSVIKEARANYSQYDSYTEVSMTMNGEGSRKWANITEANKDMNIAIVLDGCVYSAPVVRQRIDGGNSSIAGDFTIQEAQDLANVLKSGAMPVSVTILE